MITLDGSAGEGGGQILRTGLSMSLVTGKPFRIERIRAGRKRPGLRRQHLTAVHAAAEIGRAKIEGAAIGSQQLGFIPGRIRPGRYRFAVGSPGSATLVFQTVLPPLLCGAGPSRLELEGGTHNPWAPPLDFLQAALLPIISRMGPGLEVTLKRPGFYPAGGGRFSARIQPSRQLSPVHLLKRGQIVRRSVRGLVSRLPIEIARRELSTIQAQLGWPEQSARAETVESAGPGNCVMIEIQSEQVTELLTGFGRRGVRAEQVAREAADQARRYLSAGVPVGEHLADQLLIPMAIAGAGTFRTLAPSQHTRTNIEVIRRFLDVEIRSQQLSPDVWEISIQSG